MQWRGNTDLKWSAFIVVTCPDTGKLLLCCKRNGTWSFVGGNSQKSDKIPLITALREFYEETRTPIMDVNYGCTYEDKDGKRIFIFEADLHRNIPISLSEEHTGYKWFDFKEIKKLKMNPRHRLIFETICGWE